MRKWLQKAASMLLAAMMVLAVMPVWGVAETVTTPSDLPEGTAVPTEAPTEEPTEVPTEEPTEIPTEEPTEVPTEEPVEEVPPVLVEEDVVEPPMLMAANQDDPSAYGLSTRDGKFSVDEFGNLTLESGSFETIGGKGLQVGNHRVTIKPEASLRMSGSGHTYFGINVYGSLTVELHSTLSDWIDVYNGGHLYDVGNSNYVSIYLEEGTMTTLRSKVTGDLIMEKSTLTMEVGSEVKHFEANDSTVNMDGGKISSYGSFTNCTLNGNKAAFSDRLILTNTKGELQNGSIHSLVVDQPSSGMFTTNATTITTLNVTSNDWLQAAVMDYTKNALKLYQGGTAPTNVTYPQSADYVTLAHDRLQLNSFNQGKNIYFVLYRNGTEKIGDNAITYPYRITCNFGDSTQSIDVNFPVIAKPKIHLAGGTVTKTYDGNGNFSGTVKDPVWQFENGDTYDTALACTVEGTGCTNYQAGGYQNVVCTKVTVSGTPPSDVNIDTASCKVNVMVSKRDVTLTPNNMEIYPGESSEITINGTGLVANDFPTGYELKIINADGDPVPIEQARATAGKYSVEIRENTGKIQSSAGVDVTNNYQIKYGDGFLTVKEPTFTVTIPAQVGAASTMDIACDFLGYSSVGVSISSANWELHSSDTTITIPYALTNAGEKHADSNDYAISFDNKGVKTLGFDVQPTGNPPAGTYTDTLTFTVSAAN